MDTRRRLALLLTAVLLFSSLGAAPGRAASYGSTLASPAQAGGLAGLSPTANWTADADQPQAWFGYSSASAGDVNGDGYDDVIVGAPYYDGGNTNEGRALVYYGSATGLSTTPGWTAEGDHENAWFGWSVAGAGDVDGDGYDDVIVGANRYDNGWTNEGGAFVYYGSATGLSATLGWLAEGDQASAEFGYSVGSAGDVNGDGYDDVIVGARLYDNGQGDEGRASVYYGSASGLSTGAGWWAESDQDGAELGCAVGSAGDVNGDGYGDVVIGAYRYDDGQNEEGKAFVFHGSISGLGASGSPLNADWQAAGDQADAWFGWSVGTAGDVSSDGYADLIVGAYIYHNGEAEEGRALVYYGSASGLSTTHAWSAEGNVVGSWFGYSVATAGDVDGDGYDDAIVGAIRWGASPLIDQGRAYLYHGSAAGLSTSPNWTATSDQGYAYYGVSLGTAGDVNDDGYGDVIVGARGYGDAGESEEGWAFGYHGAPVTVDGDPGEWDPPGWLLDPPTTPNTGRSGRGSGQYIWADATGDQRTDGDDPDGNYDLTQLRLTGDGTNLYALLRFSDIADAARPYVGIGVDTTLDGAGQNWLGDLADTQVSSAALWEREIVANLDKTGLYDAAFAWSSAGASYISAANDTIEISMPWSSLGVALPARLRFTVMIAQNSGGGTREIGEGDVSDALDAVTWTGPNTWDEVSDRIIHYFFDAWFTPTGEPYPPLLISEVYYDPNGVEPDEEWIQITNVSGVTIDLGGYKLGDAETRGETGEGMKQFPGGSVADRDSVVVANKATAFDALGYGCTTAPEYELVNTDATPDMLAYGTWGSSSIQLSNSADEVLLLDGSDTVIDVLVYEGGSYPGVNPHPGAAQGSSLERSFVPDGPSDIDDCAVDFAAVPSGGSPCYAPTLVELASFTAIAQEEGILVAWETLSEMDHAGFNLLRSETAEGGYTHLNDGLIPAQGGPTQPATYLYEDPAVAGGTTYYYKLEAVDVYGKSQLFGPVHATAGMWHRAYLPQAAR